MAVQARTSSAPSTVSATIDNSARGSGAFNTAWKGFAAQRDRRMAKFNRTKSTDFGAIVFIGDSITEVWDLAKAFPCLKTANRGISGDTSRGMLQRMQDNVLDLAPRACVILCGINDLNQPGGTPESIADNVRLMLEDARTAHPTMPVLVCEILPSTTQEAKRIRLANALVDAVVAGFPQARRVRLFERFADADGRPRAALFSDGTHLKALGYAIWQDAMREAFAAEGIPAIPGQPAPYGALPSPAQLAWHELECYAFVHFTTNTFTGREWGFGDESPSIFNPTAFDADQIVGTIAKAGFKGVILTCKHHDGFCLWPTRTTRHSVAASPWKGGRGDVVREFSEAAARAGIRFGVYVSPWDRNHPGYGTPAYVAAYHEQVRELTTQYGPLFEIWFDGANGGDGYYGGERGRRNIDRSGYYQWDKVWAGIRQAQPKAAIFSDVGPDVRWVGNESGSAHYPCWATYDPRHPGGGVPAPGLTRYQEGQDGTMGGSLWIPAECDVSIRPGWFWHEEEDARVRTPRDLYELYFKSVGNGASFLLNIPPDRRGRLHENDVASLRGFKAALDTLFATDFAGGAKVSADKVRGPDFSPGLVLDGRRDTYWSTPDGDTQGTLTLEFPDAREFDVIRLREFIQLGQRVRTFTTEVREGGAWKPWIGGSSIGAQVLRRGRLVKADAVRIHFADCAAVPCISEVALFREPANIPDSLSGAAGPDARIHDSRGWKIVATAETTDHPAALLLDGRPSTFWCTHDSARGELPPPQSVTIDMGRQLPVAALAVTPRQDGLTHGMVDKYAVEWSADGRSWSTPMAGEFSNVRANPVEQRITLPHPVEARFIRFTATSVLEKSHVALADIRVLAP